MKVVLYAPEDQQHLNLLLLHLRNVQPLCISSNIDTLMVTPIEYMLLLMSIDLLYRLKCEMEYNQLYRRLKLLEHEGMIRIIELRACAWEDSFKCGTALPGAATITEVPLAERAVIYQHIATKLELDDSTKK